MKALGSAYMKKVLIVNSSPREEGNCTTFSVHLKKKLDDSTIPCKLINLKDYRIEFCTGCFECDETGKCVIDDDYTNTIIPAVKECDILIWVSPNYCRLLSSRLKLFIERLCPIYGYLDENTKEYAIYVSGETSLDNIAMAAETIQRFAEVDDIHMKKICNPVLNLGEFDESKVDEMFDAIKKSLNN